MLITVRHPERSEGDDDRPRNDEEREGNGRLQRIANPKFEPIVPSPPCRVFVLARPAGSIFTSNNFTGRAKQTNRQRFTEMTVTDCFGPSASVISFGICRPRNDDVHEGIMSQQSIQQPNLYYLRTSETMKKTLLPVKTRCFQKSAILNLHRKLFLKCTWEDTFTSHAA
jgi:hypothetical protein